MYCSPPGPSVHGILQARKLEWAAISFSGGIFPTQGSNLSLLHCRQTLYHLSHQGSQAVKIHKENPAHSLEVEIISTQRSQLQVLSATGELCPGNHRVEAKGRSLSQIHRGSIGKGFSEGVGILEDSQHWLDK